MCDVWAAVLDREGDILLVKYLLDTWVTNMLYILSLIFRSQKGTIEALNFLIITL